MILMVKGDEKLYVPDIAVVGYRSLGWRGDGEPEPVAVEEVVEEPAAEPAGEVEDPNDKFVCEHCGKEFGSKAALTKHVKKDHTEV